jgi:hypothetical protein
MASAENTRVILVNKAEKVSAEIAHHLLGFLNDEVSKAVRAAILTFDRLPEDQFEREALIADALAAASVATENVIADMLKRLRGNNAIRWTELARRDVPLAVRKAITKAFPLGGIQSPVAPPPLRLSVKENRVIPALLPVPEALPPRLTASEITAIVDIPTSELRRVGSGGFGETFKVVYGGRTYLRKDIEFHEDPFTKWSFGTEVKYLEIISSHPLYSLTPLTPYYFGSMIRGDTGYIIEELFSGENLHNILKERFLTPEEGNFIEQSLDFYVHQFFHKQLGILHLDLKPHNIFVRMHQNIIVSVHLLDLGLTRAIGEEGFIAGTAAFMSPAQHAARKSGLRKIKHVEEFNTYALDRISGFIQSSVAPLDAIRELNTAPLVPRPWEVDIAESITNVLCSFALLLFVPDEILLSLLSIPGVDINKRSMDGNTPLIVAVANKNRILSVSYIRKGADVNMRNTRGSTPLHWAASQGLVGTLKLLLDVGAEKDALTLETDPWEPLATPLHWACKAGQSDTAVALLDAGVNLTLRDGNGETAADLAKKKRDIMINFIMALDAQKSRMGGGRTRRQRKTRRRLRNKKHYSRAK